MKVSSRIIFFGNERLSSGFDPKGAPTLQALINNGYDVVAVVANHQKAASRKPRPLAIEVVAKKHHIPLLLPAKLTDIQEELAALRPTAGVLVAYGKIIPDSIIKLFPKGIINIHPSLLPKYRGPTPIEQAILNGDNQTGVSLMRVEKAMDAGPLFSQERVQLTGQETKTELTETLLNLGGEMLIKKLPAILNDTIAPVAQNNAQATYCSLIKKTDGQLDLNKPALQLEKEVRAYYGWPKSRVTLLGQDIIITEAQVVTGNSSDTLAVSCGNNTWLEIVSLIAPSGRTMSGVDFLRGYRRQS